MPRNPIDHDMSRRSFLIKGSLFMAAAAAGGMFSCNGPYGCDKKALPGGIAGANWKAGHRLIEPGQFVPKETVHTGVVIVGGGIAGLSAGRELLKNRVSDFLLLEVEQKVGGNAASGGNAVSPYPWGAHYIPLPGSDSVLVRDLFEELGLIQGYDKKGLPIYNEYYLCADPQERLFIHGQWQEGLVPQLGLPDRDRRQIAEFFKTMKKFKQATGGDGKRAFTIPIDHSSQDNRFRTYDAVSMSKYLSDNGWDSEYLRWYVNYCCRDDYGCCMDDVSAWAGIHYFASRNGVAANADSHAVLTWPEGLGWIVNKMSGNLREHIRCNACVVNIESVGDELAVDYVDVRHNVPVRVRAKAVVYAAPRFTALRTVRDFREKLPSYAGGFEYAPWMTANITVKSVPEGKGADLSWDNVSYYSDSLGYVVANHQDIALHRNKTVLTYYLPLTAAEPVVERQKAIQRRFEEWAGMIVRDLSRMHPGIESQIEEVNVWLWGHAMIRPLPGFIWGRARAEAARPHGNIHFAHSDMSGISIFEEAQYRGISAARAAVR